MPEITVVAASRRGGTRRRWPSGRPIWSSLITVIGVVGLAIGLAACGGSARSQEEDSPASTFSSTIEGGGWTSRGNLARTGVQPGPGLTGQPTTRWAADLGAPVESSPAVVDGVVYIGAGTIGNGAVFALDATTGAVRWRAATGGHTQSSPAVAGGLVFVGCNDGVVYAFDTATGQERWRFTTTQPVLGSPVVVDGALYVAGDDTYLYALDAATGEQRWRFKRNSGASATPAVADGIVYVGGGDLETSDPSLYAVDAKSGKERWKVSLGSWIYDAPAVAGGIVYAGTNTYLSDGVFVALDAKSGKERWRVRLDGNEGAPAVANGAVYIHGDDGNELIALDATTGAVSWRLATRMHADFIPDMPSPSIVGGVLFVPDRGVPGVNGTLISAIDAATGKRLWSWDGAMAFDAYPELSAPVIVGGTIYIGSDDHHLYAVGGDAGVPTPATPSAAG